MNQISGLMGRAFDGVISFANFLGVILLVCLAILINVDVFGRAFFNNPLIGVPEIAGMGIVVLVYLQITHSLRGGNMTRSTGFLSLFAAKRPRLAQFIEALYHFVGFMLFLIISYAVWLTLVRAWNGDEYVGVVGIFTFPVWPLKAVVTFGSLLAALQFARIGFKHLYLAFNPAAVAAFEGAQNESH